MIAVLIPTSSPAALIKAPPELPRFISANEQTQAQRIQPNLPQLPNNVNMNNQFDVNFQSQQHPQQSYANDKS